MFLFLLLLFFFLKLLNLIFSRVYSLVFLLSWAVGFGMGLGRLVTTVSQTGEEFALTDAFQVQVTVVIFTVGGVTNERCEVKCDFHRVGEHGLWKGVVSLDFCRK